MIEQDAPFSGDDAVDLLERPVLTVAAPDGARFGVSLAGLLARLGRGGPTEMAHLRPHQQHVVHALVVQLAALVCARTGILELDRDEHEWRRALRALAGGAEAFQLVVSDLSKPAFLQPPVPEGSIDAWKRVETPDSLDVLVLAKNHDVKARRMMRARDEHWVFALLSLQTQQGFSGRDNYGVARMNGGFGNRPGLGLAPSLAWAPRFQRDVRVALDARPSLLAEGTGYRDGGTALLWTAPWDGAVSEGLSSLDPFFIEVCRRVRLARVEGRLVAYTQSTKVARLDAKELKGNTGDLWTPVARDDAAALTLGGTGFTYAKLSQLLFEDEWIRPPALRPRAEDGATPIAVARALVRGQGKTEGLHERIVLVPEAARGFFASPEGRARLGTLARARIAASTSLRLRILKPAICAFLQGGRDELRLDDDRANSFLAAVDRRIDAEFFPRLFEDVNVDPDEQSRRFDTWLVALGRETLRAATDGLPTASARRERAIAAAESRFFGAARKHLPCAFERAVAENSIEEHAE